MIPTGYYSADDLDAAALGRVLERETTAADAPRAQSIEANVPIYDGAASAAALADDRRAVLAEWAALLAEGPGALVIRRTVTDGALLDEVTDIYLGIIAAEAAANAGKGDHFAAAGNNARIWNSAQKLCLAAPRAFAPYFGNVLIDAVCEAWLGPGYQMTAQVNLVRPGGKAQTGHRDYHLGFQTPAATLEFPAQVHALSPALTLQGAIAHCDMPIESGPTKLLPFSQTFGPGYAASELDAFQALFEARAVQLPLARGDSLFFSPALLHAAGSNTSRDIERMANLLQVSSAFGRAMESLDREAMSIALYPALRELAGELDAARIDAAIAACAEGYPFPTNLDNDPPLYGKAPESQAGLMRRALDAGWSDDEFAAAIDEQARRRVP